MIPLLDLRAQYRAIRHEIDPAVQAVLDSGAYVLGAPVGDFEDAFAAFCGTRHAIGVDSGTSALHLALRAAGIGPGDEVVTTPMTFVATVAAILQSGARPVLADIEDSCWTIDPDRILAALTSRTRAIIPVHLHGRPADMDAIDRIARANGLLIIEDAAQAHGARDRGRRVGSIGAAGCFSFYPGKNLGAFGEAGAVVTDDDGLAARLRLLRDWGQAEKYRHVLQGFNHRMDAIQGAVLGVKLRHLDGWTEARRRHAARYDAGLAGEAAIGLPGRREDTDPAHHVYAVRVAGRERVQAELLRLGIATGIHYPTPVHLQPAYADLGYRAGDLPAAEALARETLSLPLYPELTQAQVDQVIEGLRSVVGRASA